MTQPVKKTDTHAIVAPTARPGEALPVYGSNTYSIVNPATGEVVERVEGFGAALAAQAKWNALAKSRGQ